MEDKINDILCKLHDGKIDVDKTIEEINDIKYIENVKHDVEQEPTKRAKKIKIYINAIDDEENGKSIKINLPAISLKFIKMIGTFGIKMAVKYSDKKDSEISTEDIDKIKYLFDALTLLPPFEIVNIDSKDAKIHIYTC